MTARFITLEGGEGVGKSTQLDLIAGHLDQRGIPFIKTREPGGTPLSEAIRDVVISPDIEPATAQTEFLLMFASRAQHVERVVRPALERGDWVLCSRFTDSTFAYSGGGRGIPDAHIQALDDMICQGLKPDLTLLLDCDPEVSLSRAKARGKLDRIELEAMHFFKSVRNAYLKRAHAEPDRFLILDATQPETQVFDHIQAEINKFI